MIHVSRIGSFTKLLRVTALVIKSVSKLKKCLKTENARDNDRNEDFLNGSELNKAEQLWTESVQTESFPKELQFLRSNDNKVNPPVYVSQFGLFLDEGIIKCKGRVNNSSLRIGSRNPVLFPSKHPFVQLVIKNVHNSIMHFGVSQTVTALREWIIRGREAVKGIVKGCVIYRRYEGTSYKSLPTADLPIERVSDDPPFTHIGLDFAGPLFVSSSNSSKAIQDTIKDYICVFTCASTQAIHLELTRGLDVQSFLLALRRYSSRRPATITSDNAKAFKASCKEIRRIGLTGLRERKQPRNGISDRDCISVGDLVILKKNFAHRGFWKLAKVEQLIKGSGGRVRAAVGKVARSNNKGPVYLRRVIQHLVPLEVGIGVQ